MIKERAPGKLYIAGEYAVVEPNHSAILVAVNKFVTVEVLPFERGIIYTNLLNKPVNWKRSNGRILGENQESLSFLYSSMQVVEEYLNEQGVNLIYYTLKIESELDQEQKKYGLGSSAAVTVAAIKTLLAFYNKSVNKEELFKLASLAHLKLNTNGSLGDIAASVYTGVISYTSFDRLWVKNKMDEPISQLIKIPWPYLEINSLTPPNDFKLLVGWTKKPASTSNLVREITQLKTLDPNRYAQFLSESKTCVEQIVEGFKQGDLSLIKKEITRNRLLLKTLSNKIETKELAKLCDIAERFNGAAKSSGAGGGDCGIVIIEEYEELIPLLHKWTEQGIFPINLKIYFD